MKRLPFVCVSAVTTLLALAACVNSSSSPNPPTFDGGAEPDVGSSSGSSGSSGAPDGGDGGLPGNDGSSGGSDAAEGGSSGSLRAVYIVGFLRDPLPDGGPPPTGIFGYTVDTTSGAVAPFDTDAVTPGVQPYIAAGLSPSSAAATPDGKFLYVVNSGSASQSVSAFAMNAKAGGLTPIGTYTDQLSGSNAYELLVDRAAKHVYVTRSAGASIVVFDIAADGSLTAQATTAATLLQPRGMAMSAAGDTLVVTNEGGESTSSFTVDPSTGALSNRQSTSTVGSPICVVHHPTKKVVYTLGSNGNVVYANAYDGTGAFTSLGSQPAGSTPMTGTVDPSGAFLYVPNSNDTTMSVYPLDPVTGALGTAIVSSMLPSLRTGKGITLDPGGKLLFVGGADTALLSAVSIGAAGALTHLPSSAPPGTAGFANPILAP